MAQPQQLHAIALELSESDYLKAAKDIAEAWVGNNPAIVVWPSNLFGAKVLMVAWGDNHTVWGSST
jgi:hypothetical protein